MARAEGHAFLLVTGSLLVGSKKFDHLHDMNPTFNFYYSTVNFFNLSLAPHPPTSHGVINDDSGVTGSDY